MIENGTKSRSLFYKNLEKKTTTVFFFELTVICILVFSSLPYHNVKAQEALEFENSTITASNIRFDLDIPSTDPQIRKGTLVLGLDEDRRFERLGSIQITDTIKVFRAKMYFKAQANIYTTYRQEQVFSNAYLKQSTPIRFLRMYTSEDPIVPKIDPWSGPFDFEFYYNEYLGTDIVIARGFDTWVNVNIDFDSQIPEFLQIDAETYSIKTTDIEGITQQVTLESAEKGEIGSFDVRFSEDARPTQPQEAEDPNEEEVDRDVGDAANDVGYKNTIKLSGIQERITSPVTAQQGFRDASAGNLDRYDGHYRVRCAIVPEVVTFVEKIKYNYFEKLVIDTQDCAICIDGLSEPAGVHRLSYPYCDKSVERVIGWQIKNGYLQMDFEIEMDIWSTVEVSYKKIGDRIALPIPDPELSDYYFNNFILGTQQVEQVTGEALVDINQIIIYIIIAVSLIAFGYIFIRFILPRLPNIISQFRKAQRRAQARK